MEKFKIEFQRWTSPTAYDVVTDQIDAIGYTDAAHKFNRMYPEARKTGKANISRPGKEGKFSLDQLL